MTGQLVSASRAGEEPHSAGLLTQTSGGYTLAFHEAFLEKPEQFRDSTCDAIDIGGIPQQVADFEPRTLWVIEGGEPLTLLDAKMTINWQIAPIQNYEGRRALRGAHVKGEDTHVAGLRIGLARGATGWSSDKESASQSGELRPWTKDGWDGVELSLKRSATLWDVTQHGIADILVLTKLWTGSDRVPGPVEVHLPGQGWVNFEGAFGPATKSMSTSLLPLSVLRLHHFSQWLDSITLLRPLPFIAVHDQSLLQVDAHLIATALEGLHRRLQPNAGAAWTRGTSKEQLRRSKRAAVKGAISLLDDEIIDQGARTAFQSAVAHVGEPTFTERVTEVALPVYQIAPYLFGASMEDWIKRLRTMRNAESHQINSTFDDNETSAYYCMTATGRWVLRLALLQQLVSDDDLESALASSSKFGFMLANVDRERLWQDSLYEAFQRRRVRRSS